MLYLWSRGLLRIYGGERVMPQALIFPMCWNDRQISAEKGQGRGYSGYAGVGSSNHPSSSRKSRSPISSGPPPSLSSSSGSSSVLESWIHFFSFRAFRHPWKCYWLWQKLGLLFVWTAWYAPEFQCFYFLNSRLKDEYLTQMFECWLHVSVTCQCK